MNPSTAPGADGQSERQAPGATGATAPSPGQAPALSLPKGGGAIRGIGESFTANPATGTASMTIPVAVSPARGNLVPQLALSYDSGAGNGPFGFGWSLSLARIERRTDRGLPRYRDGEDSDTFLLSGAEELVPTGPATETDGHRVRRYRPRVDTLFARIERWVRVSDGDTHWRSISRDNITNVYGPDRVSRLQHPAEPGAGETPRVFAWLVSESYDDKGNVVRYEYAREDGAGVRTMQAHEANRAPADRAVNLYPKRIRYGNVVSRLHPDPPADGRDAFLFEVVFDYGEPHLRAVDPEPGIPADEQLRRVRATADPGPAADGPPERRWPVRPDPFSSHRAGFEVRTYRRCHRVLMFHRFDELGPEPCLVRSLDLDYADLDDIDIDIDVDGTGGTGEVAARVDAELAHQGSTRFGSFLRSVTQTGYVRSPDTPTEEVDGATYVTYVARSLPAVELEHRRARIDDEVREPNPEDLENLPTGIAGDYRLVDLDGDGVAGILTDHRGAWSYKAPLGEARFGPQQAIAAPSLGTLGGGRQLVDVDGDGRLDLMVLDREAPGVHARDDDQGWAPFRPFARHPTISLDDPNVRLVDLDGDGRADVLVTEDEVVTCYRSLGDEGFAPAEHVRKGWDEDRGPCLVLADRSDAIYLADMSGDGLSDLVRIRNGEVAYWPSHGYGSFGPKVTMDASPWFDPPDTFDHARLHLADIDGSGPTDLVYLGGDGARVYLNHSGNGWSGARPLPQVPPTDGLATVTTADLLGRGTACLVWSTPLPAPGRATLRYVDLMADGKPHLLARIVNNLGAETHVHYAPSTRFSLADKRAGRPWATRLPFPVQVVERVETHDRVSGNRFVSRFAYHHGRYDGVEREFCGFGQVDQWDTEEWSAMNAGEVPGGTNFDATSDVPPVLTRSWFHTGAHGERGRVSRALAHEYHRPPGLTDDEVEALLLDDTPLPDGLAPDDEREACRALKGSLLRREVYGLDESPRAAHPYTVTEQNVTVRVLQPSGVGRHAVFLTHPRESIEHTYERDPDDPRVNHRLVLEVDDHGNERRTAVVAYPRRTPDTTLDPRERAEQAELHLVATENDVTNPIDGPADHRAPLPAESRTFEVTGLAVPGGRARFSLGDLTGPGGLGDADPIGYEEVPTAGTVQKRLIERVRTLYRADSLNTVLPVGTVEARAVPFDSYKLALTPPLVEELFDGRLTDEMLTAAGYEHGDGDPLWWVPTGRAFYSPGSNDDADDELAHARRHFFQPHRHRDSRHAEGFDTETHITYDRYDLLPVEVRDPVGNRATAGERDTDPDDPLVKIGLDYRVLKPALVMDQNRNRERAVFDALGLVAATALMGKPEDVPAVGDRLDGVVADLPEAAVAAALDDPVASTVGLVGPATGRFVYDVLAYQRSRDMAQVRPAGVVSLARETHVADLPGGGVSAVQCRLTYSDGFGREIQTKARVEPGAGTDPRWVGSGWKIFDNKGRLVRQYEPFFTATHAFEPEVEEGVSPIRCYDPVGRLVATLHPNRTWDKSVFDAWGRTTWDPNDTVLIADPTTDPDVGDFFRRLPASVSTPTWHTARKDGGLGADEEAAAERAAVHAATPSRLALDPMGRTVLTVAHNAFRGDGAAPNEPRTEERYATRVTLDVEGNVRRVVDAKDRLVARFGYDMLGNCVRTASMEAGDRATLHNTAGHPEHAWDGLGRHLHTVYDALRRPIEVRLREGAGPAVVVERSTFGESVAGADAANLRTRLAERRDQAGVAAMPAYDFKGNIVRSTRVFAAEYRNTVDWSDPTQVPLDDAEYEHRTSFDALNRPTSLTTPDGSTVTPTYNQSGLVERIDVAVRGGAAAAFVTAVDYDARGRQARVELGNGATTTYQYDPETSRLGRLRTTGGPAGATALQDLRYTVDPVGNITNVHDDAVQDVFFANRRVEPSTDFTYDAIYQLISATGREHVANATSSTYDDAARVGLAHPHDGNALGRYHERYRYDEVGNIVEMRHRGTDPASPGWTRTYVYDEPSQLDPAARSNRLTRTTVGADVSVYSNGGDGYDADGNLLRMPHLPVMAWDFHDRLRMTRRQEADNGERTYYVYEPDGTRVRKVTESADGQVKDERRYLGGFEVYLRNGLNGLVRETLHVRDTSGGERRLALVETRTDIASPSRVRYQVDDQLGSARVELDDQAQVLSYEEYTPFGSTALQTAAPQLASPKRYRYTGKERDEESGLQHHQTRYYAPWLGRWTSADPAGLKDSVNRYVYVRNHPTGLVDPDGRSGVEPNLLSPAPAGAGGRAVGVGGAAAAGSGSGGGGGSGGGSGGGGSGGSGIGAAIGRAFNSVASGLAELADTLGTWLPGLIAAPLAGLVDIVGGFFRTLGGIFSWKGDTVLTGLKEMGLGALRILGLKEVVNEGFGSAGGTSRDFKMPKTLAADIKYAWDEKAKDAWMNGYKSWHAASNAAVQQRLGPSPIGVLGLWIAGLIHESPIDWQSFQDEERNQGTVNHILDSLGDLVANIIGQVLGLLLPYKPAVAAAAWVGRWLIPGPADHDPNVAGAGGGPAYSGNPGDAWWKWKKYGS